MTPDRLSNAKEFWATLHDLTDPLEMLDTPRNRAASGTFSIAADHHAAIILLLENGLYSSGFALLRVLFEAYLRGVWLKHSASDDQLLDFWRGKEPPKTMIAEIEAKEAFSSGVLSDWKKKYWPALCDFTHTGGLHVRRWQTESAVEPNFDATQIEECLNSAEALGALAAVELVQLRKSGDTGEAVLELVKKRWPEGAAENAKPD